MIRRVAIRKSLRPKEFELVPIDDRNRANIKKEFDYIRLEGSTFIPGTINSEKNGVFTIKDGNDTIEHKVGESSGIFVDNEKRIIYFEGYKEKNDLKLISLYAHLKNN
jgi:hypothetical protein|tara:strand:- start:323 stop:646 length:324 start_codon:yes stop_codon:yes gene_type:complete